MKNKGLLANLRGFPGGEMKFSTVIVNYNGGEHIVDAIASVLMQDPAHEIVIVDNGSTDGSLQRAREYVAKQDTQVSVLFVEMGENKGFAAAFNTGYAHTSGDVILRLDNDAALSPGAMAEAKRYFERALEAKNVGMIAPLVVFRTMHEREVEMINATGMDMYWDASAEDRDLRKVVPWPLVEEKYNLADQTMGPPGCIAFIRREVFEKVGLLDESFFNYFEDVDFALRAQRAGFTCKHVPWIRGTHIGGAGMKSQPSEWKLEMLHRNQARTLTRNFGTWARLRGLVIFHLRTLTMRRKALPEYRAHKKAVAFLWCERKTLRAQRKKIRQLGPDRNVDRWIKRGWI